MSEDLHHFNLHGHYVFDRYRPITMCPRKGVYGHLRVLPPVDLHDKVENFDGETWASTTESLLDGTISICATHVSIPEDILKQFTTVNEGTTSKLNWVDLMKSKGRDLSQVILEAVQKRKKQNKSLQSYQDTESTSSSSEPKSGYGITSVFKQAVKAVSRELARRDYNSSDVIKPLTKEGAVEEEDDLAIAEMMGEDIIPDDTLITDEQGEFSFSQEDFTHIESFHDTMPSEPVLVPNDTVDYIHSLIQLIIHAQNIEGCAALALLLILPETIHSDTFDLSSYIPQALRAWIIVPAIVCYMSNEEWTAFNKIAGTSVQKAAITPIPLKPGDHIFREMRDKGALKLIQHHGIYTGNGRVVHFSGNEVSLKALLSKHGNAKIKSTSILKFMMPGGRLKVRRYKHCDPPEIVISRAEEFLAIQSFKKYNFLRNNCEHFCFYCKTGKARSKQVETDLKIAAIVAAAALGATAVALISTRK